MRKLDTLFDRTFTRSGWTARLRCLSAQILYPCLVLALRRISLGVPAVIPLGETASRHVLILLLTSFPLLPDAGSGFRGSAGFLHGLPRS